MPQMPRFILTWDGLDKGRYHTLADAQDGAARHGVDVRDGLAQLWDVYYDRDATAALLSYVGPYDAGLDRLVDNGHIDLEAEEWS